MMAAAVAFQFSQSDQKVIYILEKKKKQEMLIPKPNRCYYVRAPASTMTIVITMVSTSYTIQRQ